MVAFSVVLMAFIRQLIDNLPECLITCRLSICHVNNIQRVAKINSLTSFAAWNFYTNHADVIVIDINL